MMLSKLRIALAATIVALAATATVSLQLSAQAFVLQVPEQEVTRDGRPVSGHGGP